MPIRPRAPIDLRFLRRLGKKTRTGNEFNAMTSSYTLKLGLRVCHTNNKAQKIDGSILKTFGIVLASF